MTFKKLPVGIANLSNLLSDGCIYIDKTKFVKKLFDQGRYYFLSRPRRFGKSLFLDTLKQAFLGNKDLFNGLYLENNWDWSKKYPVLHINFGEGVLRSKLDLEGKINKILDEFYISYDIANKYQEVSSRFAYLIKEISSKTNSELVILVDEYDKPILDNILDKNAAIEVREELKNLYSVIKSSEEYIRFVLLTGVTKFSKVSLFSGLNNLNDITIDGRYADICGYTQNELEREFCDYLVDVDKEQLKAWYNGYNFGGVLEQKVYNSFDILLFFSKNKEYRSYWFETATPTFLLKLLQQNNYYLPELENYYANEELLSSFDIDKTRFETLLFQCGYLTIVEKVSNPISATINYRLNYPNNEVRMSLTGSLLNYFINDSSILSNTSRLLADTLVSRDFDRLKQVLASFFAGLPYNWYVNNKIAEYEGFYAMVIYCLFNSLGIAAIPEDRTNKGRIDLTIYLPEYKIILEFKLTTLGDAKSALQQIKDKNYAQKYQSENKPIYLMGISFNPDERNIEDVVWETLVQ